MDSKGLFMLIPTGILVIAFVYFNFIFPRKAEKEKKQKEENNK